MPEQVLNDLGVVAVLPEQRCVAVAKSVPTLQRNAEFCSYGLDVNLHDFRHPVGLLALLLWACEDVVTVICVWRLCPPQQQLVDQGVIQRNRVA